MERSVTCFLPFSDTSSVKATVASLRESGLVSSVFVVVPPGNEETFKIAVPVRSLRTVLPQPMHLRRWQQLPAHLIL
jgi:P2-related tail formation protein